MIIHTNGLFMLFHCFIPIKYAKLYGYTSSKTCVINMQTTIECPCCKGMYKSLLANGICLLCDERIRILNTICIGCKQNRTNGICNECEHQQCETCNKKSFIIRDTNMCRTCYQIYGMDKCDK